MFGGTAPEEDVKDESPSRGGRVAPILGSLVAGVLIGMAVYYLAFPAKEALPTMPALTEMRSANIPLSAFEENRRAVGVRVIEPAPDRRHDPVLFQLALREVLLGNGGRGHEDFSLLLFLCLRMGAAGSARGIRTHYHDEHLPRPVFSGHPRVMPRLFPLIRRLSSAQSHNQEDSR